jgi:hypothetical protein
VPGVTKLLQAPIMDYTGRAANREGPSPGSPS